MSTLYRCGVPDCHTQGPSNIFINIPCNSRTTFRWLEVIANDEHVIDRSALVCLRHFKDKQLLVDKHGKVVGVDPTTLPSIFGNNYYNFEFGHKRGLHYFYPGYMFEVKDRDTDPPSFNDIDLEKSDFLMDFDYFKENFESRLDGCVNEWTVNVNEDSVVFFVLSLKGGHNNVKSSVKIDDFLMVEITLCGKIMDPLDVTRWLPAHGKITRWSQLKMLLFQFGVDGDKVRNVVFDVNLTFNKKPIGFKIKDEIM